MESTIEDTEEGLNSDRETFCFSKMRLMEPAVIPEYVKKFLPPDHRREVSIKLYYRFDNYINYQIT